MPTVIEIVTEYLKSGGFDGLANGELDCGCFLDDLAPCGEIGGECCAGLKAVIDDEVVCVETPTASVSMRTDECRALLHEGVTGFGRILVSTENIEAVNDWLKRSLKVLAKAP